MDFSWLSNAMGEGGGFDTFLKNPNNLQMLSQLGSGISQGQPFGQAVGDSMSTKIENEQLQKAVAKNSSSNKDMLQMVLEALGNKKLLSPTSDGKGFDKVTIDGDGKLSLSYDPTKNKANSYGTNIPLETEVKQPYDVKPPMRGKEENDLEAQSILPFLLASRG